MSGFKINVNGQSIKVNQGIGDLKAGINRGGDLSRISTYSGNQGLHTGNNSQTVGRGNQPFGQIKK